VSLTASTRLGPYEILAPIGAGGMGEVYKARDTRLGREVAIKVLPAEMSRDPERLSRFEQEARSASALNHPNIVTIHDIGQADSVSYISMELVEGRSLREILSSGALPVRRLLGIAVQIAEGLAKAHAAGIVHRDLKPENLMVSNDGFLKILDFGLAKLSAPATEELSGALTMAGPQTGAGVVLGSVGYMSPEQASGRALDFRSDQFSLGCVLYEMATGRKAFRKETAVETLAAILREEPEPAGSVNARLPAPLCWIVERCLAKEPDERYASTRDLAQDLAALRDRFLEAPPPPRGARPPNLPVQRTAFVGRVREQAVLREILKRPEAFLVTLTGPGGIGKTRLALEVARELAADFPGGVHFVGLATVTDPAAIASAIAQVLGAREDAGQQPLAALQEHLQASDRLPMLLLLDSFEHLVSAASLVADLGAWGSGLKVLVTSRSPLHVYGENEFPVLPLALPDRRTAAPEELLRCEAVALFLQRARAVKPNFLMTAESAGVIAEICARLDGLPLAIELAAARVKLLSPAAMRARLENRLQLLTGGSRDLPARQQTLRGAIDWSYDLLSPAEQKLFRRLSVFVGGCTLEAAEAVCDARSDLELDLLDGMASMVDKSLLQQFEPAGGEPRYVMLETIREYGLERLASSGEEPVTRRAHAAYLLVLAEEKAAEGLGEEHTAWLERLELEHDNLRAALDHLVRAGDADWGLRLGAALFQFWEEREHLAEGREKLGDLLNLAGAAARTRLRARAVFAAGVLAGEIGDPSTQALFAEALEISRELDDKSGAAVALNALAVEARSRGNLGESRSLFEESLALWRDLQDPVAEVRALSNMAKVATLEGRFEQARSLFEDCRTIFVKLGDRAGMAWALNQQGDAAREQGDAASARSLYEESLAMFQELGDRWGIAGSLADLGSLALDQGDAAGAHCLYRESMTVFRELDHRRGIARLLECFASAAARSNPQRSLCLAGAAAALRQAVGAALTASEQARLEKGLGPARGALPNAAGAAAWMEGWGMPLEFAIAEAMESGPG
jgi:predicted ATPase/tRNA A-37 threonylcarbamoyl transferase component Bud32